MACMGIDSMVKLLAVRQVRARLFIFFLSRPVHSSPVYTACTYKAPLPSPLRAQVGSVFPELLKEDASNLMAQLDLNETV